MKFLGAPYPIVKHPRGFLRTQSGIAQVKSDLLSLLQTEPGERCLVGNTLIPLVNGSEHSIESLVGKEPFWVYSFDLESNMVVPGLATAHKTAENAQLMEIKLDNNEVIRCTPNHLWLLRDGEYRRADDLVIGDSLMPLYRNLNTSKYERVYQPALGDYRETHLCFVEGERQAGVREVVHHKVVDIKLLQIREDCYDLKVDKYHNFGLSAGVFVHNCMLPEFGTPLKQIFFDPNDSQIVDKTRTVVANAIAMWEPRIAVTAIEVTNSKDAIKQSLHPLDTGENTEHILMIKINFTDYIDIEQVQELKLEIPLNS